MNTKAIAFLRKAKTRKLSYGKLLNTEDAHRSSVVHLLSEGADEFDEDQYQHGGQVELQGQEGDLDCACHLYAWHNGTLTAIGFRGFGPRYPNPVSFKSWLA